MIAWEISRERGTEHRKISVLTPLGWHLSIPASLAEGLPPSRPSVHVNLKGRGEIDSVIQGGGLTVQEVQK